MSAELKTSDEWQKEFLHPRVLDPDGWDRKNFVHSWYTEKLSYPEYYDKVIRSTCEFILNQTKK